VLASLNWKRGNTPPPNKISEVLDHPRDCPPFVYMPSKVHMIKMILKAA